ncbi:protein FAR1-RELATED SEQUENCE 9 isoform X3 [Brachypodium distachyon]|uniref:Protein FAR1-RELATED SEQUENCE n=1 Tax=Brachypodium distachyon TaxID=15368 RepID=A0A0Q3H0E7_BRADI|nr:protein FAR1-RELATED SEQUENCE 9 isoform X3 [Brachypodium distachyon]KQK16535.1 hypothetical protein BRADI_1g29147v3 [Brachypodium distachyon]|eukprot:XP_024316860.1 protein FAR1-RELATED SEQUENCE 9 isoform X3 [Brachypodium distachyon]
MSSPSASASASGQPDPTPTNLSPKPLPSSSDSASATLQSSPPNPKSLAPPPIPKPNAAAGEEDCTPRMDMEFSSEQHAYDFYRRYASKAGFSVRRRYTNKSKKTGEVTSCKFACSLEGFNNRTSHISITPPSSSTSSRRTGCNAHLILRRTEHGFQVYAFQPRHNHPLFLFPPQPAALLPSPGFSLHSSSFSTQSTDDDATALPLRTRRQWEIKYGEAAALLNYLRRQSLADPSFHHAVQLDVEDKVANVFWADARMVIDYSHFGDVVAFDVLSRNCISLRHFASFVGCNSFGEPVIFGLALMYDETCESFQWLFQTFLHAMSGQAPKTFFSHQDTVITKAVSLAMPCTSHAICAWHVKHAATRNVNRLAKGHCDFIKEFKACINNYDEEAEFLASWEAMINKYDLRDNVWLHKLFQEKEKWARPYAKGIFSAGMSTRLNERLNSDVRDHLRAEVDIVLFLRHLQKVIKDRRYKELEFEYSSRLKLPCLKIRAPMLTQASEVYTSMIFQLFQEEYEEFQSAYIVNRDEGGPCREYIVSIVEKEKQYTVYGSSMEQTVSCSCRKFETIGFLCSHALKILDTMDIKYIPDRYIMRRWTKYARCLTSPEVLGQTVQAERSEEISNRYQHMCPKYVRLVARASECEESYRVLDQFWGELSEKVEEILQKQSIGTSVTQPDVHNLKMSLSSITNGTGSENVLDKSCSTPARIVKKKDKKSKGHPVNYIEKGLRKKQKVHLEQPAVQYAVLNASAQSENAMFQGTDLSSSMGDINYEETRSGLSPTFTPELDFCGLSQFSGGK